MSESLIDLKSFGKKSMFEFDNSFNMFVGTGDKNLDWFDNPYVEVNVYDLTQAYVPKLSENVTMRKCDKEKDIKKFVKDNVAEYWPNALCFDDKRKIKIFSNWFDDEYSNFYIAIDACKDRPGKSQPCKPLHEIKQFVSQTVFYIVS